MINIKDAIILLVMWFVSDYLNTNFIHDEKGYIFILPIFYLVYIICGYITHELFKENSIKYTLCKVRLYLSINLIKLTVLIMPEGLLKDLFTEFITKYIKRP